VYRTPNESVSSQIPIEDNIEDITTEAQVNIIIENSTCRTSRTLQALHSLWYKCGTIITQWRRCAYLTSSVDSHLAEFYPIITLFLCLHCLHTFYMHIGTCTDEANIVQLKKLKSATLVAAKMSAMMEDMKSFAHKAVVEHGVKEQLLAT
jgi:hypothetical protein